MSHSGLFQQIVGEKSGDPSCGGAPDELNHSLFQGNGMSPAMQEVFQA